MAKHYHVEHTTRFVYETPVRESVMEVRMKPRDEWGQQCLTFDLRTAPRANVHAYRDTMGNTVHYFDIPRTHLSQAVTAASSVRVEALTVEPVDIPGDFDRLPACFEQDPLCWEMTQPSRFGETTEKLDAFAKQHDAERTDSTLSTAQRLSRLVHEHLRYEPDQTTAESTIDEALELGCGVCQDFTHVLIALCRRVGLPARYVSGYLFRGSPSEAAEPAEAVRPVEAAAQWQGQTYAQSMQQSEQAPEAEETDATHAWAEVYVPDHGWIGLDPTHDEPVGERHIRTAVGRDYADVPPTRGVYRGNSQGKMEVGVRVTELATPDQLKPIAPPTLQYTGWTPPEVMPDVPDEPKPFEYYAQQMQQQQS
ncbi:MAG: transglutaminase family protein [Planctomycetota bacterium]